MKNKYWLARKAFSVLDRQSENSILTIAVTSVIVLGLLDYVSGTELAFSLFYLGPIFLVAWYNGFRQTCAISVASLTAMIIADAMGGIPRSHPLIELWNGIVRLGFFIGIGVMVTQLKTYVNLLKAAARIDYLTGIPNRLSFHEVVNRELLRAKRIFCPITIAYIDIDRFKSINDRLGHAAGDSVLKQVARTLHSNLRATDMAARMGGDEFAVLLPNSDSRVSRNIIQKLRDSLVWLAQINEWPVGFSIGAVTFTIPQDNIYEMIRRADDLMYEVKKEGVSSFRHEVVEEKIITDIDLVLKNQLKAL